MFRQSAIVAFLIAQHISAISLTESKSYPKTVLPRIISTTDLGIYTPKEASCTPGGPTFTSATILDNLSNFCNLDIQNMNWNSCRTNDDKTQTFVSTGHYGECPWYGINYGVSDTIEIAFNVSIASGTDFNIDSTTCTQVFTAIQQGCAVGRRSAWDVVTSNAGFMIVNDGKGSAANFSYGMHLYETPVGSVN